MPTTYAQKQAPAQKKEANAAASVVDCSSQGESLQRKADMANGAVQRAETSRPNNTGMPDNLKAGIESLSGFSMDDVRVHYNSSKPATVQALAYTQGTDIHVAPGQEKHLPHEAWHVAQQMAGRVSPTTNINGMPVNDNAALEHEADVMGVKAVTQRSCANSFSKKFFSHVGTVSQRIKYVDDNGERNLCSLKEINKIRNAFRLQSYNIKDISNSVPIHPFFVDYLIRNCTSNYKPSGRLVRLLRQTKKNLEWISLNEDNYETLYNAYTRFTGINELFQKDYKKINRNQKEFVKRIEQLSINEIPKENMGFYLALLTHENLVPFPNLLTVKPNMDLYENTKSSNEKRSITSDFCIYRSMKLRDFGKNFDKDCHGGCLEEALFYFLRNISEPTVLVEFKLKNVIPNNLLGEISSDSEGEKSDKNSLGRKNEKTTFTGLEKEIFSVHMGKGKRTRDMKHDEKDGANAFFEHYKDNALVSVIAQKNVTDDRVKNELNSFVDKTINDYWTWQETVV